MHSLNLNIYTKQEGQDDTLGLFVSYRKTFAAIFTHNDMFPVCFVSSPIKEFAMTDRISIVTCIIESKAAVILVLKCM